MDEEALQKILYPSRLGRIAGLTEEVLPFGMGHQEALLNLSNGCF